MELIWKHLGIVGPIEVTDTFRAGATLTGLVKAGQKPTHLKLTRADLEQLSLMSPATLDKYIVHLMLALNYKTELE